MSAEFAVDDASGKERIFKTWDEACGFAVCLAACGKENVHIDILCFSLEDARSIGLKEQYQEYPDASVTTRIEIKANDAGRIA